jgi:hypothetical protein
MCLAFDESCPGVNTTFKLESSLSRMNQIGTTLGLRSLRTVDIFPVRVPDMSKV